MERKFYTENFEKFLKGHADQFKMTPSKKVWHGIYNDLHPGQRWPSIAMSMVFIFTLVIIGHLNTNNGHNTTLPELNRVAVTDVIKTENISLNTKRSLPKNSLPGIQGNDLSQNNGLNVPGSEPNDVIYEKVAANRITASEEIVKNNIITTAENKIEIPSPGNTTTGIIENNPVSSTADIAVNREQTPIEIKDQAEVNATMPAAEVNLTTETTIITAPVNAASLTKPKMNHITWTYHITPSLSYRTFSDKNMNNAVMHGRIIGYEAGLSMSFNLVKKLQFVSGFQINYSGYNIKANNSHPIMASLILNSDKPGQYYTYSSMSHYGNSTGSDYTVLKNYSLQASLPIGLQYGFGGNQNVKYGIAATVQPSFLINSKAYLLSTDKRNYLTNDDLFRNLNMNGNFTFYTSFTSNAFNLQIGPQIRYQFFSTYSDRYQVKEHLVNYGIRLGISKSSK